MLSLSDPRDEDDMAADNGSGGRVAKTGSLDAEKGRVFW